MNMARVGKLLYKSNILRITSYLYKEVIYITVAYYCIKKVTPLYVLLVNNIT